MDNVVMCLLEASGKWPNDLPAVQRIKAAFRLKLAKELHDKYSLITTIYPTHVNVLKVRWTVYSIYNNFYRQAGAKVGIQLAV